MKIQELFNDDKLDAIQATLVVATQNGKNITRAALARRLELTNESSDVEDKTKNLAIEAILGAMITLNIIPGYASRRGPQGGIGRVGEATENTLKTPAMFPTGFLEKAQVALDRLIPEASRNRITRKECAAAMGMSGSDTETLISKALNTNQLPAFNISRGIYGGIGRILNTSSTTNISLPSKELSPLLDN